MYDPERENENNPGSKAKYYLKESKPLGVSKFGKFKIPLPDEFRKGKAAASDSVSQDKNDDDNDGPSNPKEMTKIGGKTKGSNDTKTFAIRNVVWVPHRRKSTR